MDLNKKTDCSLGILKMIMIMRRKERKRWRSYGKTPSKQKHREILLLFRLTSKNIFTELRLRDMHDDLNLVNYKSEGIQLSTNSTLLPRLRRVHRLQLCKNICLRVRSVTRNLLRLEHWNR